MSPIDRQLIYRKISLIEADITRLRQYSALTEDVYLTDETAQLAVERLLERIVGRLLDINYHILKEQTNSLPQDYFDSFLALSREGIVSEELSRRVAKSAGLRNVLAHEYDAVDERQVYAAIKFALTDVPEYLRSILSWLK
jgi:uncharacterized protein YutE (UPF0331/DUF86 family)